MKDTLYETLRAAGAPLSASELARALHAPAEAVQPELDALAREGRVALTRKGKYAPSEALGLVPARVSFQRNGTPLAHPLSGGPALTMKLEGPLRPMPEDRVLVRPVGEVCALHSILARGRESFAAYVRLEKRAPRGRRGEAKVIATAVPCDLRIPYDVVLTGDLSFARNDQLALLVVERYPEQNRPIFARVERVLGPSASMLALMRATAEDAGFATELPPEVEVEARDIPDAVSSADQAGRSDLRELLTFTIDGATAKDFDDAVSIRHLDESWELGVHIADVSHYVRPGTAIDADALRRGTSLYLPGLTVPMLPEALSNHLCSLMPEEDRLAMSLFMTVRGGKIVDHRLEKSVIRSHARLTYAQVNRFFEGGDADIAPEVRQALLDMRALSHTLREHRQAAGAIDLEMDEPEFVLDDQGMPEEILVEPRGESERIIEDFMLAANETVAALARSVELPFIYRVHEPPDADRLAALEDYLSQLNLAAHIGSEPHPGVLQAILEKTREHPARDVIRRSLLRALKKAQYSEKPLGHYALAMRDYCHFTSPIRRYPDLVVHRMLKLLLDGELDRAQRRAAAMPELAGDCSQREAAAVQAERQADDIMMAAYMSRQIGRKFDGVIASVTAWGFFVALSNHAEGLVHVSQLDDYFTFDRERGRLMGEATGAVFRPGDRVRVRVDYCDVPLGEIRFSLVPPRNEESAE